jgi:hypothetical protein
MHFNNIDYAVSNGRMILDDELGRLRRNSSGAFFIPAFPKRLSKIMKILSDDSFCQYPDPYSCEAKIILINTKQPKMK